MPTKNRDLLEAQRLINEAITMIEGAKDELVEKFEEGSDAWRESDKGVQAETNIAELEEALDSLNSAESNIDNQKD